VKQEAAADLEAKIQTELCAMAIERLSAKGGVVQ